MFTLVASPKTPTVFPSKLDEPFDGVVKINRLDYNKESKCFFVHMTSPELAKVNKEIIDTFGDPKNDNNLQQYVAQTLNRPAGAELSAGVQSTVAGVSCQSDKPSVEEFKAMAVEAKRQAYKAFQALLGKSVTVHQYRNRYGKMNIAYIPKQAVSETPVVTSVATQDVAPGMIDPNFNQQKSQTIASLEEQLDNLPF